MTLDLARLSEFAYLTNSVSNLLLVTPQVDKGIRPHAKSGLGYEDSILFHFNGEQTARFESDITDHYTENNSSIEDFIALRPEVITTQGFIGELSDYLPPDFQTIKEVKEKLVSMSAYAPELSIFATRAYNLAFQAYQLVTNISDNVSRFTSLSDEDQTKQQKQFNLFYGYWSERRLFDVQTPWTTFTNMAIQSVTAIQSAETDTLSTFEVTFKQIRFAKEEVGVFFGRTISENIQQGRSLNQALDGTSSGGSITRPNSSTPMSLG